MSAWLIPWILYTYKIKTAHDYCAIIILYYYMDIKNLSLLELKQLLSCVNQDIKSIKRANKAAAIKSAIMDNEYIVANNIAKSFTGNKQVNPVQNGKLIADIQIQKDILDYLNNGGHIITGRPSNKLTSKAVRGAKSGLKLYRKFAV